MSTKYVRDTIRAELRTLYGSDYREVTNAAPQPVLGQSWLSLDFHAVSNSMISMGNPGCWREAGDARITFWTPAGDGDDAGLTLADEVIAHFRRWYDATGRLRIADVSAPVEIGSPDAEGLFYGLSVDLSYEYDYNA